MAQWYANGVAAAFGSTGAGGAPNIDYLSDTINIALLTNAYTPNYATHAFFSDVVANEASGTGYSAGGTTLGTKTLTVTAANLWATTAATSTAYTLGRIVRPSAANGYVYRATVAGTSGGSAPTWPTVVGQTVTDGSVTWTNVGVAVVQWDAADPSWTSSTITARYAVIYDRTPATDATRPLMCLIDFGSDKSTSSGTFAVTIDALGFLVITV